MAALFPAYFLPLLPFVELCERGEAVAATAFATRTKKLSFVVLLYLLHTTPLRSIAEWCGLRCFLRPSDAVVTLNLVYVRRSLLFPDRALVHSGRSPNSQPQITENIRATTFQLPLFLLSYDMATDPRPIRPKWPDSTSFGFHASKNFFCSLYIRQRASKT